VCDDKIQPESICLVILDRDGVINVDRGTWVLQPEDFEMIPGVAESIGNLSKKGVALAVATNQSCVGRKLISMEDLDRIHDKMQNVLNEHGGQIPSIYVAPDTPDKATSRRKPGPTMLLEALQNFRVTGDKALMVGDTTNDMLAAARAGVQHRVLVCTGHGEKRGEAILSSGINLPLVVSDSSNEKFGIPDEALPVVVCADLPDAINYYFH